MPVLRVAVGNVVRAGRMAGTRAGPSAGTCVGALSQLGMRHGVKAMCRARSGRRKCRSDRARARCKARTGCTAKARARGKVVQVRRTECSIPWHSQQFAFSPHGTCLRF